MGLITKESGKAGKLAATLLAAGCLVAAAASAADDKENSVFGLTEAAFTARMHGFVCKDADGGARARAERACGIEAPFMPNVPAKMIVLFKQDRLVASATQIDAANFEKAKEYLTAKYGVPDGRESKADNEIHYWYDGTRLLVLSKTSPEVPRGKSLLVSSIEENVVAEAKKLIGQKKAAENQSYDALLGGAAVAPRKDVASTAAPAASVPPQKAPAATPPADDVRGRYVSENDLRKQKKAEEDAKLIAALEAVRGKTYWYRPNKEKPLTPILFLEPGKSGRAPVPYKERANQFFVTAETSFVVVDYERLNENSAFEHYFLRLEFPGGKIGYLAVPLTASSQPDTYPIIKLYPGKDNASDYEEYLFARPPQEILAAEEKAAAAHAAAIKAKEDKAAADYKARGGVKIGMTSRQVLNSNWGRPISVNRTITPRGTHEQWVYGGSNYLYFESGILTAIQN